MLDETVIVTEYGAEVPDLGTAETANFRRRSIQGDTSTFRDSNLALDLAEPREISLQHRLVGKTPNARAQHRFAVKRVEIGADNVERFSTVALTIEMPIHADFTVDKIVRDTTVLLGAFKADPKANESDFVTLLLAFLRGEL